MNTFWRHQFPGSACGVPWSFPPEPFPLSEFTSLGILALWRSGKRADTGSQFLACRFKNIDGNLLFQDLGSPPLVRREECEESFERILKFLKCCRRSSRVEITGMLFGKQRYSCRKRDPWS